MANTQSRARTHVEWAAHPVKITKWSVCVCVCCVRSLWQSELNFNLENDLCCMCVITNATSQQNYSTKNILFIPFFDMQRRLVRLDTTRP